MKRELVKNVTSRFASLTFVFAMVIVLASCQKDEVSEPMGELKSSAAVAPGSESIAEVAIANGFDELVSALKYVDGELNTGLVTLFLEGKDQYTVFAPTNQAFQNLYTALKVDAITDLPAELVRDVLFYHVVEGRRAANSVVPPRKDRKITTLLGVSFTVSSSGVITDGAGNKVNIALPNQSASNGIIHVIDGVLLP